MTFGKARAGRLLVTVAAALAIVAGSAAVPAWTGDASESASTWPVPVGSPTPTHHGHHPA